jgi:hypothetical protein
MTNKRLIKIPYEQEFWIESVFIYRIQSNLNQNEIELPDFDRLSNCIIGIDDKFIYNNGDSLNLTERFADAYITENKSKIAIDYILKQMLEIKNRSIEKEYFELTHNINLLYKYMLKEIKSALKLINTKSKKTKLPF